MQDNTRVRYFQGISANRAPGAGEFKTIDEVIGLIESDPTIKLTVETIRGSSPEATGPLKKHLPVVQFQHGEDDKPNPLVPLDIENVDPERVKTFEESIYLSFESPRGKGRRAIILRLPDECAESWDKWTAYAKAVEKILDIPSTRGQASPDRVRYLSHDPRPHYNPEAAPFVMPAPEWEAPLPAIDNNEALKIAGPMLRAGKSEEEIFKVLKEYDRSVSDSIDTDAGLWRYVKQWVKQYGVKPPEVSELMQYLVKPDDNYPKLDPIVLAPCGRPVLMKGGILTIVGGSKSGKTHLINAISKTASGAPTWGFTSPIPWGVRILHLDFELEMSLAVEHRKRMGAGVLMYSLRKIAPARVGSFVTALLDLHRPEVVILDTAADTVTSPNDDQEVNTLVRQLMGLCDEQRVAVIAAIHYNPGSETKTRGHLGSQLERKTTHQLRIVTEKGPDEVRRIETQFGRLGNMLPIWMRWDDAAVDFVPCDEPLAEPVGRPSLLGAIPFGTHLSADEIVDLYPGDDRDKVIKRVRQWVHRGQLIKVGELYRKA